MTTHPPRSGRGACKPPGASSHSEDTPSVQVELVFWAGAKTVAGVASEIWPVDTLGAALRAAAERRRQERFDRLLQVCTVLIDGVVVHPADYDKVRHSPVRAEILPPFAGGESRWSDALRPSMLWRRGGGGVVRYMDICLTNRDEPGGAAGLALASST